MDSFLVLLDKVGSIGFDQWSQGAKHKGRRWRWMLVLLVAGDGPPGNLSREADVFAALVWVLKADPRDDPIGIGRDRPRTCSQEGRVDLFQLGVVFGMHHGRCTPDLPVIGDAPPKEFFSGTPVQQEDGLFRKTSKGIPDAR